MRRGAQSLCNGRTKGSGLGLWRQQAFATRIDRGSPVFEAGRAGRESRPHRSRPGSLPDWSRQDPEFPPSQVAPLLLAPVAELVNKGELA